MTTENKIDSAFTKLREFKKHRVHKYVVSIIIVLIATLIQHFAWDYIGAAPFLLFYPAIILASLYGDGTSAIILSSVSWQYFFANPKFSLVMQWPQDYLRTVIFLLAGILVRKIVRSQEESKLKAESVAELLHKEKDVREGFVATLTHDLQTPLTAVKLQLQLLMRKNLESENQKPLIKMEKNLTRIEHMIRDLLDANKINVGEGLPLVIEECNLKHVLESSLEQLKDIHGDRFVIKEAESASGYWSCEGVVRIIQNLCSNAVKYGDPNAKVEIRGEKVPEGVLISVNNKGEVIPESEQASLFKAFQRSKSAMRSQTKGWGLGLALVKGISESHGGSVEVFSNEKEGTTFVVFLPLDARIKQAQIIEAFY